MVFLQILSDPSGDSFVENPHAPRADPNRDVSHFVRSKEQDHALGIYTNAEIEATESIKPDSNADANADADMVSISSSITSSTELLRCQEGEVADEEEKAASGKAAVAFEATGIVGLPRVLSAATSAQNDVKQQSVETVLDLREEVLSFPTNCPECGSPAATKMKVTSKNDLLILFGTVRWKCFVIDSTVEPCNSGKFGHPKFFCYCGAFRYCGALRYCGAFRYFKGSIVKK